MREKKTFISGSTQFNNLSTFILSASKFDCHVHVPTLTNYRCFSDMSVTNIYTQNYYSWIRNKKYFNKKNTLEFTIISRQFIAN